MVGEEFILRGLRLNGAGAQPTIVQRTEQEFIPALLEELRAGGAALNPLSATPDADAAGAAFNRLNATAISPRQSSASRLKLFQPVQRTFNVALLDLACRQFSFPPVDPARIESAGLVVRRLAVDRNGAPTGQAQGWMNAGNRVRGWLTFGTEGQARFWQEFDPDADPDPQRRPQALSAGQAEIDRQLRLRLGATEKFNESVAPLFVAPPEVCRAARRTILYGLVPVTSAERSEPGPLHSAAGAAREPAYDAALLEQALPAHLPDFLQRADRPGLARGVPSAGSYVTRADAEGSVVTFTRALRQLKIEFDAFGDRGEGGALFLQLNQIVLDNPVGIGERRLGQFLKDAAAVLVENGTASLLMPQAWPQISQDQERGFVQTIKSVLTRRLDEFTGSEGRFDDVRPSSPRQYRLRAFVRIKRDDGCPPQLVWSEYSEPFTIAPWYEGGQGPPTQINLPDVLKGGLGALKPNVAFVVPESLANVLNGNSPDKFIKGEGGLGGGGIAFDWICSFSIPLITICAFIVLNIFLQLFNIIFQWLLFIKICIPFPRKK